MLRFFYHFISAMGFIFTSLGLLATAAYLNYDPVFEVEQNKDILTLRPSASLPHNHPQLQPRTIEEQKDNFEYFHGRKLLKERKERYLEAWKAEETLNWTTAAPKFDQVKLKIKYRSNVETEFSGSIFGHPFSLKAPASKTWRTVYHKLKLASKSQTEIELQHTKEQVDFMFLSLEEDKN